MPEKLKAPALVKRMTCDAESWKIHTNGGLILTSERFKAYHPAHPVAVVRLDDPDALIAFGVSTGYGPGVVRPILAALGLLPPVKRHASARVTCG